jgi:thiamine pyrophosphokinase
MVISDRDCNRGTGTPGSGLVITGGEGPSGGVTVDATEEWCLVAADSGLDRAELLGLNVDVVVGDMDSLKDPTVLERMKGAVIERYPTDKDWTDTEIACNYLWKRNIDNITILGGGGGRMDHFFGVLQMFHRRRYPWRWITDRDVLTVIDGTLEFDAPPGGRVSFFPAGSEECRMESVGLKWPLDNLIWSSGDAGVSNECLKEKCQVKVLTGRLLMVHALPMHLVL